MKLRNFCVTIAALLALVGCVLVNDFGAAWEEAKPDVCLSKIAESLYYAEFNRPAAEGEIDQLARGWSYEKQNYLLLKKNAADKGGRLYRFRVTNGIFERFRLAPTMRDDFKRDYPNAPVSLKRDTATLESLNPETLKLLASVASHDAYWESADKILYNPMLNPACRFEDRDLNKLAEDAAPKHTRKTHDKK